MLESFAIRIYFYIILSYDTAEMLESHAYQPPFLEPVYVQFFKSNHARKKTQSRKTRNICKLVKQTAFTKNIFHVPNYQC